MPKYVFFTKQVEPVGSPNHVYNIMRETLPYWRYYFPEESEYVIKHCSFVETQIERNYARDSIIAKVIGTMTEQDYVWYKLKYGVGQAI